MDDLDINQRMKFFLKMAGGATRVGSKTGIPRGSLNNIANTKSKPGFDIIQGIFRTYPTLNFKWFLFGGDEPMWLDKPQDVDNILMSNLSEDQVGYSSSEKGRNKSDEKRWDRLCQLLEIQTDYIKKQNEMINKLLLK